MTLPLDDIVSLIPQKTPFVMVGRLLYADQSSTRSSFRIERNNVFVKNNIFQEAGLLENMAQTAALGVGYKAKAADKPVAVGYIGAVKDLEIFSLPKADDELVTEIAIQNQIFNVTIFSAKIWLDKNLLAQCEMKVFADSQNNRIEEEK